MLAALLAAVTLAPQGPLPLAIDGELLAGGQPAAGVELVLTTGYRTAVDGDMLWNSGYPPPRRCAEPTADGQGRFRLQLALPGDRNYLGDEPTLIAWRDGHCAGAWLTDPSALAPGVTLRCELDADEPARVVVRDPEGQPCAGARIRVIALRVGDGAVLLTPELTARLTATAGADGTATLAQCTASRLAALEVTTDRFGTQLVAGRRDGTGLDTVQLRKCGTVHGRVRGAPVPDGLVVDVRSWSPVPRGGSAAEDERRQQGAARCACAADGTFVIPILAAGSLRLREAVAEGAIGRATAAVTLAPGEVAELEIELVKPVRLTGSVLDQDGRPVANAPLRAVAQGRMVWLVADAAGHFQLDVPPGPVSVAVTDAPTGYLLPAGAFFGPRHEVPAGVERNEYPPIVLARGVTARGRVVTEGQPLAGAKVCAQWQQEVEFGPRKSMQTKVRHVVSAADGSFLVEGLPAAAKLELSAVFGTMATPKPVATEAEEPVDLVLVGAMAGGQALVIAVRNSRGEPIPASRVAITRKKIDPRVMYRPEPFAVGGQPEVLTGERGEVVVRVEPNGNYCVRATAPGFGCAWSDWRAVGTDDASPSIGLALAPLAAVHGTVVDGDGRPVAGATVFHTSEGPKPAKAVTGGDGRFDFDGLRSGTVLLFAREGDRLGLACARTGGPPTVVSFAPRRGQPCAPDDETALRELAQGALEPILAALSTADSGVQLRSLQMLACLDPARTLALADTVPWKEAWYGDAVKRDVARALLHLDHEEALMLARSLPVASSRCLTFLEAAAQLPAESAARRRFAGEALLAARVAESPQMQVAMLAGVAEAYSDLGDEAAAADVLAEAKPLVDGLPSEDWAGYARCLYAEQLARRDLDTALPYVAAQKDEFGRDRHHGNIAHELAPRDPAAAERVFALLQNPDRYAARVCYRMAPWDRERARRIAAWRGVEARTRVWCLGVMAEALVTREPRIARELLDEALDAAEAANAPAHAAAMLPTLRRLDSEAVPAWIARLLAFRRPESSASFDATGDELASRTLLAVQLRAFDREVADALAEPAWEHAAAFASAEVGRGGSTRLAAMLGWLDPRRAAAIVAAWPRSEAPTLLGESTRARLSLAKLLGMPANERMADLLKSELFLWPIDEEDL